MTELPAWLRTDEVAMAALSLGMGAEMAFELSERYCIMVEAGATHEQAIAQVFNDCET